MLRIEGLTLAQGDFRLSADLTIETGARVAVIGPSGAGKSTLLAAIAGFLSPAAGQILWQGKRVDDLPPHKRGLSVLFQDNNLFPHLSVAQNIGLGVSPALKLTAEDRALVQQALHRTGLAGMQDRTPGSLSGGQQARVALARVLVQRKPLILLDEPFAALGPALKAEMLDLVAGLAAETGATLLMVSHDPQDARRLAPQSILVAEAQAKGPFDTGDLLDSPPPALRAYLG